MDSEWTLQRILLTRRFFAPRRIEQEDKETKEKKEVLLQWRSSRQTGAEDDGEYVVIQDDYNCGIVSDKVTLPPPPAAPEVNDHVFEPPLFGVTVLGSSHGFDPSGKTSGYVLWLSKRGYMVVSVLRGAKRERRGA